MLNRISSERLDRFKLAVAQTTHLCKRNLTLWAKMLKFYFCGVIEKILPKVSLPAEMLHSITIKQYNRLIQKRNWIDAAQQVEYGTKFQNVKF
jgi:hypothetical protein